MARPHARALVSEALSDPVSMITLRSRSQNVTAGDGAAWVLTELARRLHLFILHPEAVATYVPWAKPPFYANVDEQTLMNDCLRSAITNTTTYAQAIATGSRPVIAIRPLGDDSGVLAGDRRMGGQAAQDGHSAQLVIPLEGDGGV